MFLQALQDIENDGIFIPKGKRFGVTRERGLELIEAGKAVEIININSIREIQNLPLSTDDRLEGDDVDDNYIGDEPTIIA